MTVPDAKRLRDLEAENAQLKKLLAESILDTQALKAALGGKVLTPQARRDAVMVMCEKMPQAKTATTMGLDHHARLRALLRITEHQAQLSGCAKGNLHMPSRISGRRRKRCTV